MHETASLKPVEEATRDLIRRSREGDAEAFESLYREHVGRVYALCLRMTGDPARSSEIVQDVFVAAWKGLRTFRGDAGFGTWLHRLTFNAVQQSRRGEIRWLTRFGASTDEHEELAGAAGASAEDSIDLERAIARLPRKAREALVLHDIHGYRCREVAEITGTAVGTIQAHLHRARKLLREVLDR